MDTQMEKYKSSKGIYKKMNPKDGAIYRCGFTWHNYDKSSVNALVNCTKKDNIKYIIFNHEICPTTGTPHLQGFVKLFAKKQLGPIRKMFLSFGEPTVMIFKCELKNDEGYITYSSKLDSADPNWFVYENDGKHCSWFSKSLDDETDKKEQGKRCDIEIVHEYIRNNPSSTWLEIIEAFPRQSAKFSNHFKEYLTLVHAKHVKDLVDNYNAIEFEKTKLYPWQQYIIDDLVPKAEAFKKGKIDAFDPRDLYWVYDKDTARGKSFLLKYIDWKLKSMGCKVLTLTNAASKDIAFAWNLEEVVLFDYTKSNDGHINYGIIEQLKNGRVFSPKWASGTKIAPQPYILCFANFIPKLSDVDDLRWTVIHLLGGEKSSMSRMEFQNATKFVTHSLSKAIALDENLQ